MSYAPRVLLLIAYFKLGFVVHSERGLVARVISRLGANKKESVKCSLTREHKNISIS